MVFNSKSDSIQLSVVVVNYNMQRELPRTLHSLTTDYQIQISEDDYEVIVVDNGSNSLFQESEIKSFGKNFYYLPLKDPPASPAFAVNTAARMAKAGLLAIMVDGARIVTPGFLHYSISAFKLYPQMVVSTLGWHIGDRPQQESIEHGYNQIEEDELLKSINWSSNGYRLYEISSLAPSSKGGCFLPIAESNALVIRTDQFKQLKGFDEQFKIAGGGLVNLDFYQRCIQDENIKLIMLAGEASFHQFHGGISTNVNQQENRKRVKLWFDEYQRIRGKPFKITDKKPILFGEISEFALPYLAQSASAAHSEYLKRLM